MSAIIIYDKNTIDFNTLGLTTLIPTSCIIKEELNGIYELELTHPYDQLKKFEYLEKENIIFANTPNGRQAFRIYRVIPTMSDITINARHIFYDLLDNFIIKLDTRGEASKVLNDIVNNFVLPTNFTFQTNIISQSKRIIIDNENPISALLNSEQKKPKFIQQYGGELLRNNFNVKILNNIGEDKGFTIRYGKNLLGLSVDEDYSEVITRLYAYNDKEQYIIVDSENINNYYQIKIGTANFGDVEGLAEQAKNYLKTVDKPVVNISVNFLLLSQTKEYENFKFLENVKIGDIVTIYNQKMNFSKKSRVISYTYNSIADSYNNIELGDFLNVLTNNISNNNSKIRDVANESSTALSNSNKGLAEITNIKDNYATKSDLDKKLDKAIYNQEKQNFVTKQEFNSLVSRVEALEQRSQ